jgi:hypothetical protein
MLFEFVIDNASRLSIAIFIDNDRSVEENEIDVLTSLTYNA